MHLYRLCNLPTRFYPHTHPSLPFACPAPVDVGATGGAVSEGAADAGVQRRYDTPSSPPAPPAPAVATATATATVGSAPASNPFLTTAAAQAQAGSAPAATAPSTASATTEAETVPHNGPLLSVRGWV